MCLNYITNGDFWAYKRVMQESAYFSFLTYLEKNYLNISSISFRFANRKHSTHSNMLNDVPFFDDNVRKIFHFDINKICEDFFKTK